MRKKFWESCLNAMRSSFVLPASLLALSAGHATAAQLDLASIAFADPVPILGGGGVQSTTFAADSNTVTMSTSGGDVVVGIPPLDLSYRNTLKHANILNNLLGADGVCAGSNLPALVVTDCSAPLTLSFDTPVDTVELVFDNALTVLAGMTFTVIYGDSSSQSGAAGALVALDALFLDIGVANGLDAAYRFDGTGFSGVTSITYNTSLTTSVTGPVLRYLNVNEEAMGAAVPLPPSALGLVAALGLLGFAKRRRTS